MNITTISTDASADQQKCFPVIVFCYSQVTAVKRGMFIIIWMAFLPGHYKMQSLNEIAMFSSNCVQEH